MNLGYSLSPEVFSDQAPVDSEKHDLPRLPHRHHSDSIGFPVASDFASQQFNKPDQYERRNMSERELKFSSPTTSALSPNQLEDPKSNPNCLCLACILDNPLLRDTGSNIHCRIPSCGVQIRDFIDRAHDRIRKHECEHFYQAGRYMCPIENCRSTSKRPNDLVRHQRSQHCTRREKFPCKVIGCRYSGDNGFTRKDKLRSHFKNVHEGRALPGRSLRNILPAL